MSKVITLLGSTGSIGTQSLDVCRMHGYEVFGLSANSSVDKLLAQIAEFHPKYVAVTDPAAFDKLSAALAGQADAPKLLKGAEGLRALACMDGAGTVQGYAFCIFQQYVNHNIMTDIKTLYIDDLCVDEACRGQHIGTALYRHVLDFARASGCYNVTLNVWSLNESAMKFYQAQGLKPQKVGMEVLL